MAWDTSAQLLASSNLTASGSGTALDSEGASAPSGLLLFQMWVGTVTGTSPTLDVYVEESDDNSTWYEIAKFNMGVQASAAALISATKTTKNQYQAVGLRTRRYLRERHVIGGSASPTFNGVFIYARGLGVMIPAVPSAT